MTKPAQDDVVEELELALCAPNWAKSLEHVHNAIALRANQRDVNIDAVFETKDGLITGTTAAKVKRVEIQDDGSLTVVIDHWPRANQRNEVVEECARVAERAEREALSKLAEAVGPNSERTWVAAAVAVRDITKAIRALAKEQNDD